MFDSLINGGGAFDPEGYYWGYITVLVILIAGALYWYYYVRKSTPAAATAAQAASPAPAEKYMTLKGQ
jgi:uncharacterized membrane protein